MSHFLLWDFPSISLKCLGISICLSLLLVSKTSGSFPLFYSPIPYEFVALETKYFPSISPPNVVLHSLSGQACIEELTINCPVPVQTIVVRDNGMYLLKTPGWVSWNTQFKLIVSNSATHPIHFLKTFFFCPCLGFTSNSLNECFWNVQSKCLHSFQMILMSVRFQNN